VIQKKIVRNKTSIFLSRKVIKIFSCALFEILYVFKEVNIGGKKKKGGENAGGATRWNFLIIRDYYLYCKENNTTNPAYFSPLEARDKEGREHSAVRSKVKKHSPLLRKGKTILPFDKGELEGLYLLDWCNRRVVFERKSK
jgi:hypothetical protein